MDKQQFKKEQMALCDEEISKIENAIKILKETYQENLVNFEKKLEEAKFQKDIFDSYK